MQTVFGSEENPVAEDASDESAVMPATRAELQAIVDLQVKRALATPGSRDDIESVAKSVYGQLTEAAPNWYAQDCLERCAVPDSVCLDSDRHQMVVFFVTRGDGDDSDLEKASSGGKDGGNQAMIARMPLYFALSLVMVFGQCCAVSGIWNGTVKPSCRGNDQCQMRGMFCHPKLNRCEFCGSDEAVLPPWTASPDQTHVWHPAKTGYNWTWVEEYCAGNIFWDSSSESSKEGNEFSVDTAFTTSDADQLRIIWCNQCVHVPTRSVDNWGAPWLVAQNVAS